MSIRKYTMTWADERDRRCVLTMTNTLAAEGDTEEMELVPSGTPFVTSTTPDTNPLTPVRGQTGKVGFIAADGFSIVPTNDHQWRVVLRRESESRTMWTGWLKSETYNQRLWGVNEGVTLNVIDDVEAMKTWTLDADKGFGMVSLRELICECLDHVNGVAGHDTLELEWSTDVSPTSGPWTELFDMKVSRYNFFSQVADSAAHEGKTCHAVLESICKTFGWTLTMVPHLPVPGKPLHDGVKMLFSYAGAKNYMRVSYSFFKLGEWTDQAESSPSVKAIEDLQPCNLHDYSIEPGYRKVKVVSEINKASNTLPSLGFHDAAVEWVSQFDITYKYGDEDKNEGRTGSIPWRVRMLKAQGLVKTNLYENHLDQYGNPVPYNGNVTAADFDNYRGMHIVSQDFWNGPGAFPGSTPQGEEKRNYAWETVMLYKWHPSSTATVAYLTAESAGAVSFRGGGFVFNAEMHCPLDGNYVGPDVYFKKDGEDYPYGGIPFGTRMVEENGGNYIVCRLRIGEWSWTGERWEKHDTTFRIPLTLQDYYSYAKVMDNKTLDMGFNGTGYCIPANETMDGQLIFEIVNIERGNGNRIKRAYLKNVSLEYKEAEDENKLAKSEDSHEYSHTADGWTTDAEGITLDICSDKNDAANYSVLTDKDGKTVKSVWDALTEKHQRPEEALLDKLKAHMTRAREILTLRYTLADGMEPKNRFSIGEGENRKVYSLLAVKDVDWCSGDAELVLSREP